MDDYLHDMALFVEIARAGTLSRASKATSVPISTLSRRLSEFEKRIGLQLVKRSTRALELTELGKRYFARCESLVIGAASAHEELLKSSEQVEGTLKLSMTPDFGASVLAPLLVEFARIHPLINFELDLTPALTNLVESDIDIAIRFGHPEDSRLIMRRIGTSSHWLCATPSYLSVHSVPTSPNDLKKHNGIMLRRAKDLSPWSFAKEGLEVLIQLKQRFQVNTVGMICSLALHDVGIGMLPDVTAKPLIDAGRIVRVMPDWRIPSVPVLAIATSRMQPARCRLFMEFLGAHAGEVLLGEEPH